VVALQRLSAALASLGYGAYKKALVGAAQTLSDQLTYTDNKNFSGLRSWCTTV
jgi:hypothetical protein